MKALATVNLAIALGIALAAVVDYVITIRRIRRLEVTAMRGAIWT